MSKRRIIINRGLKEHTYLGCAVTRNRTAWCYRICPPDANGFGHCGRLAPHSLKSNIQRAIEKHKKKEVPVIIFMRKLKPNILEIFEHPDFNKSLPQIHEFPPQKTINALFSFLCSADKSIKNKAVLAMGEVVSRMAETDLEKARTVMRRLIWSLNEESGWIGWGSAEALGEIMARNEILAKEYHNLLISFVVEGTNNYLLYDKLREEVILGLRRLSRVHPNLVTQVQHLLKEDAVI